jgi:iron-sulfur cluster insertion protein
MHKPFRKGKITWSSVVKLAASKEVLDMSENHTHSHSHSAHSTTPVMPPLGSADASGPESMIRITDGAASKINEIRETEGIEGNMGLRLRVVGGGCAGFSYDLYFDEVTEVDRQFPLNSVNVVVDEMSLMYLVGVEIDYIEGLQSGFKFNNPNVKSTCGCGSSFSV